MMKRAKGKTNKKTALNKTTNKKIVNRTQGASQKTAGIAQLEKAWSNTPKLLQKAIQQEIYKIKQQEKKHQDHLKQIEQAIKKGIQIINSQALPRTAREKQQQHKQKQQQAQNLKKHREITQAIGKIQGEKKLQLEKQAKFEVMAKQIKILEKNWQHYLPQKKQMESEVRQLIQANRKKTNEPQKTLPLVPEDTLSLGDIFDQNQEA